MRSDPIETTKVNRAAEGSYQRPLIYGGSDRREHNDSAQYFDTLFEEDAVYLDPGQSAWSDKHSDMIIGTVGAGVIVSAHDTNLHIGAAGYVLLPQNILDAFPYFDDVDPDLMAQALAPIEDCINHMKRQGGGKNRIWMRLMGGGALPDQDEDVGIKNYVFAREYITRKGLSVLNEDLGGQYVRRVHFFPSTGRAVRLMLRRTDDFESIINTERSFQKQYKA